MIHKIKALHNEGAGLSIRSIARELDISRNTVRKYLRMDEVAIGEQQANRTRRKQLDDYWDYIVTLLGQFPGLSAVKVLRKLKERHPELGVSDRSARRYIKALKETVSLRQKRYYEPVESLPGVQCQVDGGELRGAAGRWRGNHGALRGLRPIVLAPDVRRALAPAHRYRHLHPPARCRLPLLWRSPRGVCL